MVLLEGLGVAGVRLEEVRPRHEGGGLHLALGHVLDREQCNGWMVVVMIILWLRST